PPETFFQSPSPDGLQTRAIRLRRVYQPVSAAARSLSRAGQNLGEDRRSHFKCMGQARRLLPLAPAASGMGQRSHAPLGTVVDVSKSGVLSSRSASSYE